MSPSSTSSSRWCPTPEQLMILEEMYRSGVRTPNATQIQHITAHLSLYGKIEGKNVFYWFQNHKARERQKLRRKLGKQLQQQQQQLYHHHRIHPQFQHILPNHHHLLHHFDQLPASPLSIFPPLSCRNSPKFAPQGRISCEDAMNYTWKQHLDIPEKKFEIEKSMMGMYGPDWMMMMDVVAPPPATTRSVPLKTLDLFPITATNLKEECN